MAVFKCKMCGGDLEVAENEKVAECDYCGTTQTIPSVNDEKLQGLFNRANILRMKSEFDKAEALYEKIIQTDETQAEAYWGLILCKFGVEYVEDPETFKRIPTCHRTLLDSIIADDDYKSALKYADAMQKAFYENEAKEIDRLQKDILALSKKEEPYDVFICYKETDDNGERTQDSVIANDIYYQLTQEGLKVFYAAVTLEDKIGSAYEPYIFAALNSAKVMLVIGTKPEYFNAVWVKNEWSRYLKIVQKDRSKMLVPCYRDMDAYELPEEFAHIQAQNMSKIGFINDVVRSIKKLTADNEEPPKAVKETVASTGGNGNTETLLKRVFMFLEDGDWNSADEYCEKVLDIDPENASAYLGKLLSELRVRKQESLKDQAEPFDHSNNYQKAIRFADEKSKSTLTGYIEHINTRNENERLEKERQEQIAREKAEIKEKRNQKAFAIAVSIIFVVIVFVTVLNMVIIPNCKYNYAVELMESRKYQEAMTALGEIKSYKDVADKIEECEINIIKNSQVGDYIKFGTYEQDNDTSNGQENIEWLVLEKVDSRVLVVSKYALDVEHFNTTLTEVTWETCSLREWLNYGFINSAFSENEQKMIPTVTVSADANPEYDTYPGSATQDKVFLLSIKEANRYFTTNKERMCIPTDYAIEQGAAASDSYTKDGKATCQWWLRSPGGYKELDAAIVGSDGDVDI